MTVWFCKNVIFVQKGSQKTYVDDVKDMPITFVAKYSDHIVICDFDPRGKEVGETAELVRYGLISSGFKERENTIVLDEREAVLRCLEMEKRNFVVLQNIKNENDVSTLVLNNF